MESGQRFQQKESRMRQQRLHPSGITLPQMQRSGRSAQTFKFLDGASSSSCSNGVFHFQAACVDWHHDVVP